jgi:hypothetical protein
VTDLEQFEPYPAPDPVRAAALANAVDLYASESMVAVEDVIDAARQFEAYLNGEGNG